MTTQPPSNEAVEAAILWATDKEITRAQMEMLAPDPYDNMTDGAARILAAEVERLREQNKRQGIDLCAYVAEVAELRARVAELEGQINQQKNQ